MVNSDKGITNLHVPQRHHRRRLHAGDDPRLGQDVGRRRQAARHQGVIPDRCYADVYQAIIEDCKKHGAFDPATMGTVPNVGLMAQKAEEYGSHDKTFIAPAAGTVRVVDDHGRDAARARRSRTGDIWRALPDQGRRRSRTGSSSPSAAPAPPGAPAVFWLDKNRAHDAQIIAKVETLPEGPRHHRPRHPHPDAGRGHAASRSSASARGQDTISVTGNVLRDYLTDLFPILELGTSAKMLSIVPLLAGGGLFETGAGGSAPKHVQQFQKEGYLRWDSLGEFLGARRLPRAPRPQPSRTPKAAVLAETLDQANGKFLDNNKSPGPQGRRDRQPRQPLLPRPVLGRGARRADQGQGAAGALRQRRQAACRTTRRRSTPS